MWSTAGMVQNLVLQSVGRSILAQPPLRRFAALDHGSCPASVNQTRSHWIFLERGPNAIELCLASDSAEQFRRRSVAELRRTPDGRTIAVAVTKLPKPLTLPWLI